jgi:hypothetical protein
MRDFPLLRELATHLSPFSPITYVFLALVALAACFVSDPDMSHRLTWLLLVLFAVLALCPDREVED